MSKPSTDEATRRFAAYERARAIGRAGGERGELTGLRLAARGLSWDDVAYAAILARGEYEAQVAAHDALDPAEREYRADREHWVALHAAAAAEQPGAWDRTRVELGLRPDQRPGRAQLAALEIQRMRELEATYDRAMGREPEHHERPYTAADAEADEGTDAAWWAIEGEEQQRREVGDPSTAERVHAAEASRGVWSDQQGWQLSDDDLAASGLSRDDLDRVAAVTRAEAIAARLPELSAYEVLDLASHAQNTRHVTPSGELDDVAARADLRALQTEADRRAEGQPEHSSAALLAEYVDRARLDLDPALDREKWAIAGALHRALDDETRIARQDAARAQLPEPDDTAGWAALDDDDPAVAALLEDAADPVADAAREVANTERALGVDSEEARDARADYADTHARFVRPDLEEPWRAAADEARAGAVARDERDITGGAAILPLPRSGEAPTPEEHGRPSAGHDDLDPTPTHTGPDRGERGELAAREADPWGHDERVLAEHLADQTALGGPQLSDHEYEYEEPEA